MEPYTHTARYTGMKTLLLICILSILVLTYILYRSWKKRKRREQEEARREKSNREALDKYCERFPNPYTAD